MEHNSLPTPRTSPQNHMVLQTMRVFAPAAVLWRALLVVFFASLDIPVLVVANVVGMVVYAGVYGLQQRGRPIWALIVVILELLGSAILGSVILGWDSGYYYLFFLLVFFIFMTPRINLLTQGSTAIGLGVLFLGLAIFFRDRPAGVEVESVRISSISGLNLTLTFVGLVWLAYCTRAALRNAWYTLNDAGLEIKALSKSDPLTQLLNRGYMIDLIEYERIRSERNKKVFSLVMFNIKQFSIINKQYGREAGDYILRLVGDVLRGSLRKEDQVARWAGDEFLLLLPETELEGAGIVANKVRDLIRLRTYYYEEQSILVDVYFGYSAYNGEESVVECLRRADKMVEEAVELAKRADQSTLPLDDGA